MAKCSRCGLLALSERPHDPGMCIDTMKHELERTTKALAVREETVRRLRRDLADKDMEIARLKRQQVDGCLP